MAEEKNVTNFHEGDRVEFKCRGVVSKVAPPFGSCQARRSERHRRNAGPPTHARTSLRLVR
jgi:hypothetical protein